MPGVADPTPTLNILWLEDDERFLENAMNSLEQGAATMPERIGLRFQPRVHRVATLAEALEALRRPPDLIVVDLNLSDSQGADTLMAMRQAAPETPLLVLTVVTDIEPAMMAAVENAEFLNKDDLSPTLLMRAIYMALMRVGAREPLHQPTTRNHD